MRFLNPAGLWLLLGVPILIIIYLIKSQHEERSVSSTYVWKLSERFAKKRLPFRKLRRILLFLLQLIMIILAAFMAAKPVIVKGESYDYVAILDASASMKTVDEKGNSRFENAVKAIEKQAKNLSDGHTMSVILAGDTASLLIEATQSTAEVKLALNKASCTNGGCNTAEALTLAQAVCDRSENAKVLFYTDCSYEKAGNITVVDMNKAEWNVSLTALSVEETEEDTVFTGSLISYHKDAEVTVGLSIDGKTVDAKLVRCEKDVAAEVVFSKQNLQGFDSAEIYIESKDGLEADNRTAICRKNRAKYKVLLASESPLYLESALTALGTCQLTVVPSLEGVTLAGMDLYIFDGVTPEEYPTDGSVLLFGTENLPDGLIGNAYYDVHEQLSYRTELKNEFHEGLNFYEAVVKEYTALLGNRDWEYLLYCESVPVAATTLRDNGVRFTVFSFDLHDSNLPLLPDYPIMMDNLLEYSVPEIISKTDYTVGESIVITPLPGTKEMYLRYPDASVKELYSVQEQYVARLSEVGVYTAVVKGKVSGNYADFFVHIPEGETKTVQGGEINISLTKKPEVEPKEAISEIGFWFVLAFFLILLLEWECYYYEQY